MRLLGEKHKHFSKNSTKNLSYFLSYLRSLGVYTNYIKLLIKNQHTNLSETLQSKDYYKILECNDLETQNKYNIHYIKKEYLTKYENFLNYCTDFISFFRTEILTKYIPILEMKYIDPNYNPDYYIIHKNLVKEISNTIHLQVFYINQNLPRQSITYQYRKLTIPIYKDNKSILDYNHVIQNMKQEYKTMDYKDKRELYCFIIDTIYKYIINHDKTLVKDKIYRDYKIILNDISSIIPENVMFKIILESTISETDVIQILQYSILKHKFGN